MKFMKRSFFFFFVTFKYLNFFSINRNSIVRWNILPYCLKSTLLPSDSSSDKGSLVASLSSDYWNVFLYLLILLFYLLIIFNCKVKSTFFGCNYFLFVRIRRKCSMFGNANFYQLRTTINVPLIYHCDNFHFRTCFGLFW